MLSAGFADPVLESQACFRAILDAMARPGTVQTVGAALVPPAPLDRATAAVLLTLVDPETPLWLDRACEAARPWLAFHCGAAAAPLATCSFAVGVGPVALGELRAGTDDAPELGATLVLQVAALERGERFRIEGPGLARPEVLMVEGLAEGFAEAWAANRARFPRGVDVILCAGDRLVALPRTVDLRMGLEAV